MKNNKLIAEFMGMTYGDPNDNSVMIQMTPQGNEVVPIAYQRNKREGNPTSFLINNN